MVEVPLWGPLVARMIAVPSASAVTNPVTLTVAMSGALLVQRASTRRASTRRASTCTQSASWALPTSEKQIAGPRCSAAVVVHYTTGPQWGRVGGCAVARRCPIRRARHHQRRLVILVVVLVVSARVDHRAIMPEQRQYATSLSACRDGSTNPPHESADEPEEQQDGEQRAEDEAIGHTLCVAQLSFPHSGSA